MKIPPIIESLLNASAAGGRLRDVIVAAEEHGEIAAVIGLVAEALGGSTGRAAQENCAPPVDLTSAGSVIDELLFLHPRGKQKLAFFGDQLVIKTSKQDITIMATDIEDVIVLDSIPRDHKNRVFIMLNFREDAVIKNGKTSMRACVIQVSGDQQLDIRHPKDASKRLSGIAAVVICQAIGTCGISGKAAFHGSDAKAFRSCTDTAAVEAYVKARNGFLFPLQHGLCFLESPPIFIHTGKIRSVDFARANGASATFDFQVHLKSGAIEEFSNISRHELGCIQGWVEKSGLPVGFPDTSDSDEGGPTGGTAAGDEGSSDDMSDEDFDPYKKRVKKQKLGGGDQGTNGVDGMDVAGGETSCSSPDESSSDEDGDADDCELVDEDDMKLSDLQKQLETEREVKRMDESKMVRVEGKEAGGAGKTDGGDDCSDDGSDEDFNEDQDSEDDSGDDSSDGDCELVDEEDMKLSDLQKQLETEAKRE